MEEQVTQHPDPERWWKHRRRGYYIGIWWAVIITFLFVGIELKSPGTVEKMGVVIGWAYGVSVTLIVAYYSNTAVEEFAKNRNP